MDQVREEGKVMKQSEKEWPLRNREKTFEFEVRLCL